MLNRSAKSGDEIEGEAITLQGCLSVISLRAIV